MARYSRPSDFSPFWSQIRQAYYIQQTCWYYIFVAVKSCPTLCDLMDARLLCPPLSSGTCMYIFICTYMYFIYTYKIYREFPGSPVVRTLHFHCRGHGVSQSLVGEQGTYRIYSTIKLQAPDFNLLLPRRPWHCSLFHLTLLMMLPNQKKHTKEQIVQQWVNLIQILYFIPTGGHFAALLAILGGGRARTTAEVVFHEKENSHCKLW